MMRAFSLLLVLSLVLASVVGCAEPKKKPSEPADKSAPEAAGKEPAAEPAKEAAAEVAAEKKEEMPAEAAAPAEAPAEPAAPAEKPAEPEQPAADATKGEATSVTAKSEKVVLGAPDLTAGIPGEGPLKLEDIQKWLDDPKNSEPLDFELPFGLAAGTSQINIPQDNPLTRAKIELGRQLYFDKRLSADSTVSCADCHHPDEGFGKHTQFGVGIKAQTGGRNSPVSFNRILSGKQFWDGRAASLEEQAVGPIANPIEMGNTHDACIECLKGIPGYKLQFDKIFGKLDIETVGKAIASFERTLVTEPAPYDYYERLRPFEKLDPADIDDDAELKAKYEEALAGVKEHPMSDSAKRGFAIFFSDKGGCSACHVGANLSDEKYHNIGVGMDKEKPDPGRVEFSKDSVDTGAFKTPTIRNVALSGPYMHDGSQKTLEEVVEWYAKGGHPNPHLSDKIKKLDLSDQDKADLVAFMKEGCTSAFPQVNTGRLPE